jgi:hypothetical protein
LAADNFAACFDVALEKIKQRSMSHAPWRAPFRRVRLKRFPYLLIFHGDRRVVSILALVHERREPKRTFTELTFRRSELNSHHTRGDREGLHPLSFVLCSLSPVP